MKSFTVLLLLFVAVSAVLGDGVFNGTVELGPIKSGKLITLSFPNIALPASTFQLDAVHLALVNQSSGLPFEHDSILISSIDFTMGGKKIMGFTASTTANALYFPAPYGLGVTGPLTIAVSMFTSNKVAHNVDLVYYLKWSSATNFQALTRTATSCVANYSSFAVPGTGGQYTVQNNVAWQQNINAMSFQASTSAGIVSLSLMDGATVICKSVPKYDSDNVLQYMSPCNPVVPLTKGTTYTTVAVYDNNTPRKGVFCNFQFYVGFPPKTTTSSSSTTATHTSSSSSATTGPAHTSTTGPSHSTSSSSGPSHGSSSHGGSSSGGGSATTHGSTTSGGSSQDSSQSGSSQDSSQTSSNFDTTSSSQTASATSATSSNSDTTASPTVSPTGYTISTGGESFNVWNKQPRKMRMY